ncbi:RAN GTPase-activating protein 1 [Gracilariopsis chorda]|uniref:RAN GTPase-activating protein 1 n=1 Tax=Gracilariopsis chorda TaxID=448386 RepID=A0A2V3JDL9_9FLOR|nr:RAN GTPase-activating protein 1 [Gracilariopsis chorda]|eukprot:PXF50100.1 RAN GTPase-activating protein 1 [Gracilariopsis chorda]
MHFHLDQTKRESLSTERAEELLHGLTEGVVSVKLSGKSFGDGSAQVAADALQRASPTLVHLDISDIIASRPEDEAKRTLATISDGLASCKQLEFIDLSDNALGAKGVRAIGELLTNQEKLKELLLCNNGLAADAGDLITSALLETKPTSLVKLHFHNNLLETPGSIALAPIVEHSPDLEDFRFSSLRIGREGAVRICKALQPRFQTLRYLNLADNSFGQEGAEALADAVSDAPLLETLIVSDCLLEDDGVKVICDSLRSGAPKLRSLHVAANEISITGAKALAQLIRKIKLRELVAEDNEFGNAGAVRLAKGMRRNSCLEILNVEGSEVGGRGALALAQAAAKLKCLKSLQLDKNAIPAEVVEEITRLLDERLGPLDDNDEEEDEDDEDDEDEDDEDDEEEDEEDEDEATDRQVASEVVEDARAVSEEVRGEVNNLAADINKLKI